MKVLLRENVRNLGARGEVVKVANGYARNYLLPRGLAWAASSENQRRLDAEKRKYDQRMGELKEAMQELAGKLRKTELTIKSKASEDGRLYGAVTGKDIVAAFQEEGISLDARTFNFDAHIKEVGHYQFSLQLHPHIDPVDINFIVTDEDGTLPEQPKPSEPTEPE